MARPRLREDDEHAILTALWRTVGAATKRPLVFSVRQLNGLAQRVGVDLTALQLSIGHEFLFSLQLQAVHSACFSRHLGYVYVQAEAAWPLPPCSCPATPIRPARPARPAGRLVQLTRAAPVPVPSPRSRVLCARRDFGDMACLQRSVVQWRRGHQLRLTARHLAAAGRLQHSCRALIYARMLRALVSASHELRLAAAGRLQDSCRGLIYARMLRSLVSALRLAAACRLQDSCRALIYARMLRALVSVRHEQLRLAAACRLQRSWRRAAALISARLLAAEARLLAQCQSEVRANRVLQRRWRGTRAARFAAAERDQCTALFISKHEETAPFRVQVGSSYLAKCLRLGAGSFGDVYRARKMNGLGGLGALRDYVVKVVSLQRVDGRAAANTLATEVHLLLLLNADGGHPNVLRMRAEGAFVVDGNACIPLELAAAGDLRAYMRRLYKDHGKRMPQCEGLLCAKQIAAAVAFMHERGVAHRDLKLDNVLLMRPGHAVLGDFGLGVERSTLAGGLSNAPCGTLATMAPEVYGGRWHDPMAADVWSAGVTVVALVASHKDGDDSCGDYYPWSAPDAKVISEYRWYKTLADAYAELRRSINAGLRSWPAEVPQPTAIGDLLRSSSAHNLPTGMPMELPPALLRVLDGMLRPEPNDRIAAADVHFCLELLLE